MAPMAFKHFTPNFKRARTFTFVHVHILDVRERALPATPTFGCAEWQKTDDTSPLLVCKGVIALHLYYSASGAGGTVRARGEVS